jgi:hypothetical protein
MSNGRFTGWKRFSLRTLFVLMTLCCLAVGAWSVYVNPYRTQLQSLAAVNRLQGNSAKTGADGPGWQRWLVTTLLGQDAFMRVTEVNLRACRVDDAALRSLAGLIHLESLKLDLTQITDDGISALRPMQHLKELHLRHTNLSDRAAVTLAALPRLEIVYLTGTKMTDAAINDLARHNAMTTLYIRWTRISNEGAARLAAALPHCAVYHHALVADAAN